jgi:hypothetical protein
LWPRPGRPQRDLQNAERLNWRLIADEMTEEDDVLGGDYDEE